MRASFNIKGSAERTETFLRKMARADMFSRLDRVAAEGVAALSAATPSSSGETANSWSYKITMGRTSCRITWLNSHIDNGFPVAVMLQYGHGTGTGGWVPGRDYINPALRPIMDAIAEKAWREVTSA